MAERDCYILCVRHSRSTDEALTWWGPDQKGYTYDLDRAGVYPESEARRILGSSLDVVVPVEDVKPMRVALTGSNEALWRKVWPHLTDRHNQRDKSLDGAMNDALDGDDNGVWNDGEPQCPACGAKFPDWYEDAAQFDLHANEGDRWHFECNCGRRVAVECSTTHEFRTVVMA